MGGERESERVKERETVRHVPVGEGAPENESKRGRDREGREEISPPLRTCPSGWHGVRWWSESNTLAFSADAPLPMHLPCPSLLIPLFLILHRIFPGPAARFRPRPRARPRLFFPLPLHLHLHRPPLVPLKSMLGAEE